MSRQYRLNCGAAVGPALEIVVGSQILLRRDPGTVPAALCNSKLRGRPLAAQSAFSTRAGAHRFDATYSEPQLTLTRAHSPPAHKVLHPCRWTSSGDRRTAPGNVRYG
jgi:hypothetical protein